MSDETIVIVIRFKTGEDILAIMLGEDDTHLKVQHPYFAKYGASESHILMIPYCPLTDETFYDIERSKIEFVVVAREDVTTRYLRTLVDIAIEAPQEDDDIKPEVLWSRTYLDGNDTKH